MDFLASWGRAEWFAAAAIIVSIARYSTYLYSIYKGETQPHVFSWFNWGLVVAIGTVAQFQLGGGPSAWVLLVVAVTCFFIAFVALFVGEKDITKSDWLSFIGALCAIPIWMAEKVGALAARTKASSAVVIAVYVVLHIIPILYLIL